MDENTLNRTVAGEPLRKLIPALREIRDGSRFDGDGRLHIHCEVVSEIGTPFARALMRVEAELLLEDADCLGAADVEDRTPEQRRADALVALVLRVQEALA